MKYLMIALFLAVSSQASAAVDCSEAANQSRAAKIKRNTELSETYIKISTKADSIARKTNSSKIKDRADELMIDMIYKSSNLIRENNELVSAIEDCSN